MARRATERRYLGVLVAGALGVAASGRLRADQAGFPSMEEIQKMVDNKQYAAALHELQRVLVLNGAAGNAYDRYKLLMMRAECELQLHQQPPALESLKNAKAEAYKQNKPERAEDAIALVFLIQKSVAYQYTPKAAIASGGGSHFNPAIPILDRTRRGEAFGALLTDELPGAEKKSSAITGAKTIAPVLEAAKAVGAVHAVEYAETRDDSQTAGLAHAVAEKAGRLLDQALIDSSTRLEAIADGAQQIVIENVNVYDQTSHKPYTYQRTRRRGITPRDADYLKNLTAVCEKISASALEVAQTLGAEFETMNVSIAKADAMKLRVHELESDDYLKVPAQ